MSLTETLTINHPPAAFFTDIYLSFIYNEREDENETLQNNERKSTGRLVRDDDPHGPLGKQNSTSPVQHSNGNSLQEGTFPDVNEIFGFAFSFNDLSN